MARHRGLREFTSSEMGNLSTGQAGFKMLAPSGSDVTYECGVTSGFEDITYFIGLKAIDANADVDARTYAGVPGDDLSTTGSFGGGSLTIAEGDIIYGVFDKITVTDGDYVIAYIGK